MSQASPAQPRALQPFHLAFPVTSLANARAFYGDLLGCPEGRSSPEWVDFDFFGHQLVAHLAPDETGRAGVNAVDGDDVPVRQRAGIQGLQGHQPALRQVMPYPTV